VVAPLRNTVAPDAINSDRLLPGDIRDLVLDESAAGGAGPAKLWRLWRLALRCQLGQLRRLCRRFQLCRCGRLRQLCRLRQVRVAAQSPVGQEPAVCLDVLLARASRYRRDLL